MLDEGSLAAGYGSVRKALALPGMPGQRPGVSQFGAVSPGAQGGDRLDGADPAPARTEAAAHGAWCATVPSPQLGRVQLPSNPLLNSSSETGCS